jgi:hypothetical protein
MSGRKRIAERAKVRKRMLLAKRLRVRAKKAVKLPPGGPGMFAVTMRSKGGTITIHRNTQTGRLTTNRSAAVIDTGAERFAGALKRLANK